MDSTRVSKPLYKRKRVMLPAAALIALVALGSCGSRLEQPFARTTPVAAAQDTGPHPSANSPAAAPRPTPVQTSVSPAEPSASAPTAAVVPPQAPTGTTVPPAPQPDLVGTEPPVTTAGPAPAPLLLPPPRTTSADPGESAFANCRQLHAMYPHGVARPGAHDQSSGRPVTSFTVSGPLYAANTGRDADDDGVACERR